MIRRVLFLLLGVLLGMSAALAFAAPGSAPQSVAVDSQPVFINPLPANAKNVVTVTIDIPEVGTLMGIPHTPDGRRFCHYLTDNGRDDWRACA